MPLYLPLYHISGVTWYGMTAMAAWRSGMCIWQLQTKAASIVAAYQRDIMALAAKSMGMAQTATSIIFALINIASISIS